MDISVQLLFDTEKTRLSVPLQIGLRHINTPLPHETFCKIFVSSLQVKQDVESFAVNGAICPKRQRQTLPNCF